jgi:hypothetical protein
MTEYFYDFIEMALISTTIPKNIMIRPQISSNNGGALDGDELKNGIIF